MDTQPWLKSYPPGVRWNAPLELSSVQRVLETAAERFGPLPALEFMDKQISYAELDALANRAAAGFQKLGVRPGVHVGVFMPNTPHYVIAFFGVLKAGGTVVNYSPLDALRTLQFKIEDSETEILVTLDLAAIYPQAEKLLASTRLKTLIVGEFAEMALAPGPVKAQMAAAGMLAEVERDDRHVAFRDLIDNDGRYQVHPLGELTEALAVIQYTGGTTGAPKGAMLTHANLTAACAQYVETASRTERSALTRGRGAHSLRPAAVPHLCAHGRHAARISLGSRAHLASAFRPCGGSQGHRGKENHSVLGRADDACCDPQLAWRRKNGLVVAQVLRVGRRAVASRGSRSISEARKLPIDRGLGNERDFADRHVHATHRAGKARLVRHPRARHRAEIHRRRQSGARGRVGRARGNLREGSQRDEGLLEAAGADRKRHDSGRVLSNWRRRIHGRGRLRVHRRPHQGHAAVRRVQRLSASLSKRRSTSIRLLRR